MKKTNIFSVLLLLLIFVGCEKNDTAASTEGQIFYRWTEDVNLNVCPNARIIGYMDNNDAVPDNASKNTYYGPCAAGTYQGQYNFVYVGSTPSTNTFSFTYKLEAPPIGYKRYYSKRVAGYHPPVNRCLNFAIENNLVFVDEKL